MNAPHHCRDGVKDHDLGNLHLTALTEEPPRDRGRLETLIQDRTLREDYFGNVSIAKLAGIIPESMTLRTREIADEINFVHLARFASFLP